MHSHKSMANKGLANQPGENNCFLNSAIQVLWHVDVFRESLSQLSGHRCTRVTGKEACVFCALKVTFAQFSYSSMPTLQPDLLRRALADAFCQQQRFQVGSMDDATECLENILERLHMHLCEDGSDGCAAPHCLSHRKFGMTVKEQTACPCGATAKGPQYTQLVQYVSVEAALAQIRAIQQESSSCVFRTHQFGSVIRRAAGGSELKSCPRSCGRSGTASRVLLGLPDVLTIGLAWNSSRSKLETLTEFMNAVGTTIKLADLFDSVSDPLKAQTPMQLTAVVCYYGKHYSTFCYANQHWVFYDDATVKQIGRSWQSVVGRCTRGPLQPLLLIYTCMNAQTVDTSTALTATTPLDITPAMLGAPPRPLKVTPQPPQPQPPPPKAKRSQGHRHAFSMPSVNPAAMQAPPIMSSSSEPRPPNAPAMPQRPGVCVRKLSKELESALTLRAKPPPHPRSAPPLPPKGGVAPAGGQQPPPGLPSVANLSRVRHEASTSFSGEVQTEKDKPSATVTSSSSLGPADYINRCKVATVLQMQREQAQLRQQEKMNRGWKAASVTSGDSGYDGASSYASSSVGGNTQEDAPSLIADDISSICSAMSPCLGDDEGYSDCPTLPRSPAYSPLPTVASTLPRPHRVGAPVPVRAVPSGMTRSYTGGGSTWCLAEPSPTASVASSMCDVGVSPLKYQHSAKSSPDVTGTTCARCGNPNSWVAECGSCTACGHTDASFGPRGPPPVPPPQHTKPKLVLANGQAASRHRRKTMHSRGGLGGLSSSASSYGGSAEFQAVLQLCRLCNKSTVSSVSSDFCDNCGQYMARFGQV